MRDDEDDPDSPVPGGPTGRTPPPLLYVLAFAAVYLIWGSTYLAIRVAVRSLPPFLMAGCRFILAGGILYAILRARGVGAPSRGQWARGALAGVLMLAAGNGLVTWAETRVASNVAALLVAAVPLYIALLDWARPAGVRPQRRVLVGIGVGAAGMLLLVMRGGSAPGASSAVATAALLLSGLCWSAGALYARYGAMHRHPLMAAAQQMLAGGVAQLLFSIVCGEPQRVSPAMFSTHALLAFGYLTVFGSLVAFSAFGWLVKASTPARLSTTAYVNPVVAVILGWALLGETLSGRAVAGAALIVCAVMVMTLDLAAWRPFGRRRRRI